MVRRAGGRVRRLPRRSTTRSETPTVDPTYSYTYPPGPARAGAPKLDRLAIAAMVLVLAGLA